MNNPPAFPLTAVHNPNGGIELPGAYFANAEGMSLRDYFAAAALQGLLANMSKEDRVFLAAHSNKTDAALSVARTAFIFADALLTEREK